MRHSTPIPAHSDAGFTLVEVLVAALVLITASFATLSLLDGAVKTTAQGKQRDVGNAVATEMIERATGGRYIGPTPAQIASSTNLQGTNDMVDVTAGSGPADRVRSLMATGDSTVGAVTPATPTSGAPAGPQSWTVARRGTTYTVTYLACTLSDVVAKVQIQGPADCANFGGTSCSPSALLRCSYITPQPPVAPTCTVGQSVTNPTDLSNLTVLIKLPTASALQVCAGALVGPALAASLCSAVGNSTFVNSITSGLLSSTNSLTNIIGSGISASVCPASQIDSALVGPRGTVASSTRVSVNVTWTDASGQARTIAQSELIRRPSA